MLKENEINNLTKILADPDTQKTDVPGIFIIKVEKKISQFAIINEINQQKKMQEMAQKAAQNIEILENAKADIIAKNLIKPSL